MQYLCDVRDTGSRVIPVNVVVVDVDVLTVGVVFVVGVEGVDPEVVSPEVDALKDVPDIVVTTDDPPEVEVDIEVISMGSMLADDPDEVALLAVGSVDIEPEVTSVGDELLSEVTTTVNVVASDVNTDDVPELCVVMSVNKASVVDTGLEDD